VRPAAQIGEFAFGVQRHIFTRRNGGYDLRLGMLVDTFEIVHRFVARQHLARHRNVLLGQFRHALLDRCQIFRRERAMIGKVVEESVLDDRTYRHLRIGE